MQARCFLILFLAAFHAAAQDYRAKVQGAVTDSTQAVIAGARVTLTNTATGIHAVKETDPTGRYFFDFVEPGPYTITAAHTGFSTVVQKNLQVQVRADVTVDFAMKLSSMSETITVTEAPVTVQFNTSTVETTVDRKMLTELPILARNPFSLALLDTSVVNKYTADRNPFYMYSSSELDIGGGTANSNGGQNDLLLDGAPIQLGNKGSYAPPMDAVQEFSVQQNSVDAEFGHSGGGIMSVSMKAGTNQIHGTAYYFGRNPKLNAVSNALNRTPNMVRNHIYGFSAGGPILKNKLFNFATFERWLTNDPKTTTATMPTDLERIGDFSQSKNIANGLRVIFDPQTTVLDVAANKATRQPFPGNRIPASMIDPVARIYMDKYIWKPNNPGDNITGVNNYRTTYSWMNHYWNFSDRVDYNISDKWKVFGRYSRFETVLDMSKWVDSIAANNNIGGLMHSRNIALDTVYTLTPNTVLNLRWSFGSLQDDYDPTWTEASIQQISEVWGGKLWDEAYTSNIPKRMLPAMSIAGKYTFGRSSEWFQHPRQYSWHARLSQARAAHYLKYGGEARYHRSDLVFPYPNLFNISQNYTADTYISPDTRNYGDSYATFLIGAIDNSSYAQFRDWQNVSVNYYAAYIQDDWKVNRRITLNLGLRYELEMPPVDANDRLSRYLDLTNPIPEMQKTPPKFPADVLAYNPKPTFNGAWMFADSSDRGMYNTSKTVFSPRIGMALRVDDRSALRISYAHFITPVVSLTDTQRTLDTIYGFNVITNPLPAVEGRPQARLSNPFPPNNPLQMPKQKALGRYQNLGDVGIWSNQDFDRPTSDRFTFSYQRELPNRIQVDGTYYLNRITSLFDRPVNMQDPNLGYTYKAALSRNVANPFYNYGTSDTFPGQLRNRATVSIGSLLNPYPQYLGLTQHNTEGGRERYQSWQLKAKRQFDKGYMFLFSYNYNRDRYLEYWDDIAEYNRNLTWRPSPDLRHRLSLSGSANLPFGKGRRFLAHMPAVLETVIGGWSLSNICSWNSGSYLTFGNLLLLQNKSPKLDNPTNDRWFDTSLFDRPLPYTPRTNPKQYKGLTGPGRWNFDTTLAKTFPLTERFKLEFRMEAYNLTNSIMWGNPNMTQTSSLFGRVNSQVNKGRELQYTARMHF